MAARQSLPGPGLSCPLPLAGQLGSFIPNTGLLLCLLGGSPHVAVLTTTFILTHPFVFYHDNTVCQALC